MKDKAIKDAMNSIENRIRHVYNQGYNDGVNYGIEIGRDFEKSGAYGCGLEDAWECARIMTNLSFEDFTKIFNKNYVVDAIRDYSVSEAIAKIKEYEEKQKRTCDTCQYGGHTPNDLKKCVYCVGNHGWTPKQNEDAEIKVGDEVTLDRKCSYVSNVRGVVIACNSCSDRPYKIMLGEGYSKWMKADSIDRKTGRTFPQMAEVLKQLLKGEEE